MPQFFTASCATAAVPTLAAVCSKCHPYVALAKGNLTVEVFQDQGELLLAPLRVAAEVTSSAWHPINPILAIGLANGTVVTVRMTDHARNEDRTAHLGEVRMLAWSPDGSRLVSSDNSGVVVVWKVDLAGRATPAATYRKTGIVMQCSFVAFPGQGISAAVTAAAAAAAPGAAVSATALTPPGAVIATVPARTPGATIFVFAGDSGVVSYADDAGHCVDLLTNLHSSVDVLEYDPESGRCVAITRSLLMTQLHLGADGKITGVSRAKMSVKGIAGVAGRAWVGGGVLATVSTDEPFVRCWDVIGDEHYTVSVMASGRHIAKHERLTSVAFSAHKGLLAAGTEAGQILLWRQHAKKGGGAAWEPVANTSLPSGVVSLDFSGRSGILAIRLASGDVLVLAEATLRRKLVGPVSVVQLSSNELAIERRLAPGAAAGGAGGAGGALASAPVVVMGLTTTMTIKGVDATAKHVLVWSGKACEVYQIPEGGAPAPAPAPAPAAGGEDGDAVVTAPQPSGPPLRLVATFKTAAQEMAIFGEAVYAIDDTAVLVHNFTGAVRQTISFSEAEGRPLLLDTGRRHLAVATSTGGLRVFDVSRAEPRPVAAGRFDPAAVTNVTGSSSSSGGAAGGGGAGAALGGAAEIVGIRVNCDGSRVSIIANRVQSTSTGSAATAAAPPVGTPAPPSDAAGARTPDTRVYVYSCDADRVSAFDTGVLRYPVFAAWDAEEPRLLAVQTERMRLADGGGSAGGGSGGGAAASDSHGDSEGSGEGGDAHGGRGAGAGGALDSDADEPDSEIITLFATGDADVIVGGAATSTVAAATAGASGGASGSSSTSVGGCSVIQQDSLAVEHPYDALLGAGAPYLHLLLRSDAVGAGGSRVSLRSMRDYVGLEDAEDATRRALMDFSFHMATGNMDEAYKAVKLVGNPSVWANMANMCVKSKRLDVAGVCLGQMGHARGAQALREAAKEPELEANVAVVAVQLGLLSDATRLYTACGRWDLLNSLYQSSGQWDRALAVAAKHDRINLKRTHTAYARHLESIGDTAGATKHYESAGVHRTEVTRMLHEARDSKGLALYVESKADRELDTWYAQYLEAQGDSAGAQAVYARVGDTLSLVRLACTLGQLDKAGALVHETNDAASAYHLARRLEADENYRDALAFYELSGRFNHAVRLAKRSGTDGQLMSLSLQAGKAVQLEIARHFEEGGQLDRAVQLYHKAGALGKAIDLCFAGNLFSDLRDIADELGERTSPELLRRCAEFFLSHGQFDKAASLLITAKRFSDAIDMCAEHKVTITEAMAEAMTPPRVDDEDAAARAARTELLMKLAKACKKQGSFHLATKKYTQAGNKEKAMKALLKSGDTEKIVFFAGVSRAPQIYILAANYLQTLAWHADAELLKHIVDFYTKAKAYEQLASFYEVCAALEIDEYRNYEKALAALKEALKHAGRIKSEIRDARVMSLSGRISIVERFVTARKLAKTDTAGMVDICRHLLEQRDAETAIRVGDVFALLIYFYAQQRAMTDAHGLVEAMRSRGILLDPFLDAALIEDIYRSVGVDPHEAGVLGGGGGGGGDDGGIGEDIVDEVGAGSQSGGAASSGGGRAGSGRFR